MASDNGVRFVAPSSGDTIRRYVSVLSGRRHETMEGVAYGADGMVRCTAWRWLDAQKNQAGYYMAVMPDGTQALEAWHRPPSRRITTQAGLARVARAWLKRVREEWEARQ